MKQVRIFTKVFYAQLGKIVFLRSKYSHFYIDENLIDNASYLVQKINNDPSQIIS